MSKLSDMITATQSGNTRVIPQSPIVTVNSKVRPCYNTVALVAVDEYFLSCEFKVKGVAERGDRAELAELMHMARRQIVDEVFGEFYPTIRQIERALYERDFETARTALRELENQMRA